MPRIKKIIIRAKFWPVVHKGPQTDKQTNQISYIVLERGCIFNPRRLLTLIELLHLLRSTTNDRLYLVEIKLTKISQIIKLVFNLLDESLLFKHLTTNSSNPNIQALLIISDLFRNEGVWHWKNKIFLNKYNIKIHLKATKVSKVSTQHSVLKTKILILTSTTVSTYLTRTKSACRVVV